MHNLYIVISSAPFLCNTAEWSAIGHFPTNFLHLAEQIQFARPNLLYISNWEAIDSLLQRSYFKEWPTNFKLLFQALILQGGFFRGLQILRISWIWGLPRNFFHRKLAEISTVTRIADWREDTKCR